MYNPLSTRPPATMTCTMHRTCMIHTMHTIFMPCCLTQTHHSPKPSPGGLVFGFQPNHLPSEAWYGQQPYNGSILPGNACYNKRSNIFNYLAAQYGQQPYNGSILPGNSCYNKKSNVFNGSVKYVRHFGETSIIWLPGMGNSHNIAWKCILQQKVQHIQRQC